MLVPRLMRWQTSKGEVSPVFEDNRLLPPKSYMDIHTRQEYPKELIQPEIKPENRTGTIEQLAQIEIFQEILAFIKRAR